jgi:hypothetical protein
VSEIKVKLHNEELPHFYSSLSIIRISKARRITWAGHVARKGEKRNACRWGSQREGATKKTKT